jgi:hypothetical protein
MEKAKTLPIVFLVGVVCLESCGEESSLTPKEAETQAAAIKEKENSSDFAHPSKFTLNFKSEERASSANNYGHALSETRNIKTLFDADSHYFYYEMYENRNRSPLTSMTESSWKEIIYLDGMNLISKVSNDGADYTIKNSLSANEELAIDAFNKEVAIYLDVVYDAFLSDLNYIIGLASQFSSLSSPSESESCNFYSKGDGNITVVFSTQSTNQVCSGSAFAKLSILISNTFAFDNYLFLSSENERVEKLDGAESRYTKTTEKINWNTCDTSVK